MSLPEPRSVQREFSQDSDYLSFYSDYAQVMGTSDEIILGFYETIAGLPEEGGRVSGAKSRLRAQVTLSPAHARKLADLLTAATRDRSEGPS